MSRRNFLRDVFIWGKSPGGSCSGSSCLGKNSQGKFLREGLISGKSPGEIQNVPEELPSVFFWGRKGVSPRISHMCMSEHEEIPEGCRGRALGGRIACNVR